MPTALLATIDLQDAEAKIAESKEQAKLKSQKTIACELLKDIETVLPAYIKLSGSSEMSEGLAKTCIMFRIPPEFRVPIERRVRVCTQNNMGEHEIVVRVFGEEIKAYHRDMLKDLAFIIRGIRDVIEARGS